MVATDAAGARAVGSHEVSVSAAPEEPEEPPPPRRDSPGAVRLFPSPRAREDQDVVASLADADDPRSISWAWEYRSPQAAGASWTAAPASAIDSDGARSTLPAGSYPAGVEVRARADYTDDFGAAAAQSEPVLLTEKPDRVEPEPAVNGLRAVTSPVYGRQLLGICAGSWFFSILFEDATFPTWIKGDPGAGYDGRGALARIPFSEDRFHLFAVDGDEDLDTREPIRIAADGRRAMWIRGARVLAYDAEHRGVDEVAAPTPDDQSALPDEEWVDVAWLDGYFFLAARGGQLFHSNHGSLVFDQLDFASAESEPDPNVGLSTFRRQLWVFGTKSVERWYNAGGTSFAFERDPSFSVNVGCAARHTLQEHKHAIYFLGHDGIVYAMPGNEPIRVSHEGVENAVRMSDMEKSKAVAYTELGHKFYSLTLSTGDNWTLDATTGFWAERTETGINAAAEFGDDTDAIVGLDRSLSLFVLSTTPFGDVSDIRSVAVSPVFFSRTTRTQIHSLEVQTSVPRGESAGTATLQVSDDAGATWKPERGLSQPIRSSMRWNRLGSDKFGLGVQFRLVLEYPPPTDGRPVLVLGAYATASAGLS